MSPELEDKLAHLPRRPGVYLHKDGSGKALYVGKAKNLRNRVRSYFQENRPRDGRLGIMLSKVADVEVIVTDTEAEALILENNLIKKLKPRYNINLRDDKSYPYVCIKNEPFPRVFPTRRLKKDGSTYIGPYTNAKSLRLVINTIRSIFQLRTCSLNLSEEAIASGKYQPCLEYHIKKCAAPCVGYQSRDAYDETIRQVEKLLHGKTKELVDLLRDEMDRQAQQMHFEEAAALRDQITAVEKYSQKQRIVSSDFVDRDVFAVAEDREHDVACGVVFKVREGKVIGSQQKVIRRIDDLTPEQVMQAFVERYYSETTFYPDEVLLSHEAAESETVVELLSEFKGKAVPIKVPERGDKAGLVRIVEANAKLRLDEWKVQRDRQSQDRIPHSVKSLKKDLRIEVLPRRIECFDISHLGGTGTVASCIVFEDGRAKKSEYRTFRIRSAEDGRPDDFQSMHEVVARRYRRLLEEDSPLPDLAVIDGGKGQLSSAVAAMREVGVYGRFPVVGLAKRLEEVFFPFDSDSVLIPRASASLQLLQRVRNEAHRFAVTFQKKQRRRSTLRSELLDIPGVGKKTVQKLLKAFGSLKRIRHATTDELEGVIGKAATRRIVDYYAAASAGSDAEVNDAD